MSTLRLLPQLEESLRQVPGVRAASVVTGADTTPLEVHVLTAPGKSPKQVVRDVQSLAQASFGLDIDHRIVSVVQIGDDVPSAAPASGDAPVQRPVIAAITVRTSGASAEATVTLTVAGRIYEGKAMGSVTPARRPQLLAAATVHAMEELLGQPCAVDWASVVPTGAAQVALCVLTLFGPRGGEHLISGSALVRGDEANAVVRSVLDALNRQVAA